MKITLSCGKQITYREGYLRANGVEIIVDERGLSAKHRKEAKSKIHADHGGDIAVFFFGQTHTFLDMIFS